jgi:monoterpene epsilon-lactone hydrolase
MLRALRLMFAAWFSTVLGRLRGKPRHPAWPFTFELMIRFLRKDWDETASWDFARMRNEHENRPYPRNFVKKVELRATKVGGVPATRFVPSGARSGSCVLYLHGGSYIFGSSTTTHGELIAQLALDSRIEVVALDYRLAPEHPYPAQLEDARAAFEALVAEGYAEDRIVVAGDSAGGNLALALQLDLRDRGAKQARATVLISPWSNLEMPGASFQENEPFDYGTREVLAKQAKAFAGDVALSDSRISPVRADLSKLSPVLVTVGEAEIPRDDILGLGEALKKAGTETTVHVAKDMPHNAPAFAAYHPEAQACMAAIVGFVKGALA